MYDEIRDALAGGRNIIVLHDNADADCVGAAMTLANTFPNTFLHAPGGLSRVGKKMLSSAGKQPMEEASVGSEPTKDASVDSEPTEEASTSIELVEGPDFSKYTHIIIVDAQSENMLAAEIPWDKAIVIDHHSQTFHCPARLCLIDDTAGSTCEIVWQLIGRPEKIDRPTALALLTGIIADSGHFHHADRDTLVAAAEILAAGDIIMQDALANFEMSSQDEMSQRISRMKGGQRLKYLRKGNWLVAMTQVGAFEANVARGLLGLGADVAFVASQDKENFRLTGRAKPEAVKAGLHLGEMLAQLAKEVNGEGGGHDGAAGWSGIGDVEAMLNMAGQKALDILSS